MSPLKCVLTFLVIDEGIFLLLSRRFIIVLNIFALSRTPGNKDVIKGNHIYWDLL